MTSELDTKKTILYYTGNKKHPVFEERIRQTILDNCGGLPIVSVSQRPLDFGRNICVGEVGASYLNVYRQMYIGAQAIDTEYLVFVEDDFLCPPEYYEFDPPGGDFYKYENTWMVMYKGSFHQTQPMGGMAKTSLIVRLLSEYLDGCPEWGDGKVYPNKPDFMGYPFELYSGPAMVHFKPKGNLSNSARILENRGESNLAPWGNIGRVRERYDYYGRY